jgi:hypothetical protein
MVRKWWRRHTFRFERHYQGLSIMLFRDQVQILIYPFWKLFPKVRLYGGFRRPGLGRRKEAR